MQKKLGQAFRTPGWSQWPRIMAWGEMQVLWLRYLTEISEKTRIVNPELLANPLIHQAVIGLAESPLLKVKKPTDCRSPGCTNTWGTGLHRLEMWKRIIN